MHLPTLESCDQSKPEEANLWAFVGLPGFGDSPFLVPDYLARPWSKHFHDIGFRHHPELQKRKMRKPWRGQEHSLNGAVSWVPMDSPDPDPMQLPDPAAYTDHEQEMMLERFRYLGKIPDKETKVDQARVADEDNFDPSKHTAGFIAGYLHGKPDSVIRKVMAREMNGRNRANVRKLYPGM